MLRISFGKPRERGGDDEGCPAPPGPPHHAVRNSISAMPRPPLTGCAALAVLAGSGLAGPGSAASAATTQPGEASPAALAITSVSPDYARPGSIVTVSGTLTNTSATALEGLSVQLSSSSTPFTSRSDLQEYAGNSQARGEPVPGAVTDVPRTLAPKKTVNWSVTLRPRQVPLTGFGVYPLAAEADSPVLGP